MIDQNEINIIGIATGSIGALLGILNTLNAFSDRRMKIKATLKIAYKEDSAVLRTFAYPLINTKLEFKKLVEEGKHLFYGIEIINDSRFPVSIDEAGFLQEKEIINKYKEKLWLKEDLVTPANTRPYRLEPKTSVILYNTLQDIWEIANKIKYIYIETSCGRLKTKKIRSLKRNLYRAARKNIQ